MVAASVLRIVSPRTLKSGKKLLADTPPQTSDFRHPSAAKSSLAVEAAHGCRGSDLESSIVIVCHLGSAGTERETSMSVVM